MLKRVVRASLRRLKTWLEDEPEDARAEYDETGFIYPYLNSLFASIAKDVRDVISAVVPLPGKELTK